MNMLGKIFVFTAFLTLMLATQSSIFTGIFMIASIILFVMWAYEKEEKDDKTNRKG